MLIFRWGLVQIMMPTAAVTLPADALLADTRKYKRASHQRPAAPGLWQTGALRKAYSTDAEFYSEHTASAAEEQKHANLKPKTANLLSQNVGIHFQE